ncbi:hypothetical protein MAPG_02206 [Magnaporthiopsis poae ATCC 64411]|uniref:Uncharacterized protein n=1 Tax=Magnaporthiopsis poae (strain ATCC 64411 / 73-15) TaxID=644358 RepID=A0A0C4DQR0_MAGP6|nr:hypothetical protein MAPG_02206 [Magnaporthiopsis poae ATCC 64411]
MDSISLPGQNGRHDQLPARGSQRAEEGIHDDLFNFCRRPANLNLSTPSPSHHQHLNREECTPTIASLRASFLFQSSPPRPIAKAANPGAIVTEFPGLFSSGRPMAAVNAIDLTFARRDPRVRNGRHDPLWASHGGARGLPPPHALTLSVSPVNRQLHSPTSALDAYRNRPGEPSGLDWKMCLAPPAAAGGCSRLVFFPVHGAFLGPLRRSADEIGKVFGIQTPSKSAFLSASASCFPSPVGANSLFPQMAIKLQDPAVSAAPPTTRG